MWSVGSAGKWASYWANFAPNVLSLSGFPGLKILSQKCLFLKSLVFRELAGFMGRTLKKLKRRGKERKRQKDKETKRGKERKREERRGKERKDERRKGCFFET